jgi:hypothetical protein
MKRLISVALMVALVAGAMVMPAEAAKKKKKKKKAVAKIERKVELPYMCPCGVNTPAGGRGFWIGPEGTRFGGGSLPSAAEDMFVTVEVQDAGGGTVYAFLAQDTDGDLQAETEIGEACGKTEKALPVPAPGGEVGVFIYVGTCADGTPSMPTQGTVVLTFSNIP